MLELGWECEGESDASVRSSFCEDRREGDVLRGREGFPLSFLPFEG